MAYLDVIFQRARANAGFDRRKHRTGPKDRCVIGLSPIPQHGQRIEELERAIDACEAELDPLTSFIIPGGTPKAAALHVARTVCRRAERRVVHLTAEIDLPTMVVVYLNRLSDLLFMLARVANKRAGAGEVTW